jgi:hypothetical protein
MNFGGVLFLTIFTLFWTGVVGMFDGHIGLNLYRSIRALRFAEAPGTVLASQVTTSHGSKGSTQYAVAIRYSFEVGGVARKGDRYRYGGFDSTSDSRWANTVVQQNPLGAAVKVYYDPADPANAVLSRGISGGDLFILLFLTPFNLIMFGLWS